MHNTVLQKKLRAMSETYRVLIAIDDLAQAHGCGLKPSLRKAIEGELRFRAVSAGPIAKLQRDELLPENVTLLGQDAMVAGKATG